MGDLGELVILSVLHLGQLCVAISFLGRFSCSFFSKTNHHVIYQLLDLLEWACFEGRSTHGQRRYGEASNLTASNLKSSKSMLNTLPIGIATQAALAAHLQERWVSSIRILCRRICSRHRIIRRSICSRHRVICRRLCRRHHIGVGDSCDGLLDGGFAFHHGQISTRECSKSCIFFILSVL